MKMLYINKLMMDIYEYTYTLVYIYKNTYKYTEHKYVSLILTITSNITVPMG